MHILKNLFSIYNIEHYKVVSILSLSFKFQNMYWRSKNKTNSLLIKDKNKQKKVKIKQYGNYYVRINGKNKKIVADEVVRNVRFTKKVEIIINGDNNYIDLGKCHYSGLKIKVSGNSHFIKIDDSVYNIMADINIGQKDKINRKSVTQNCKLEICKNTSIENARFYLYQNNTAIKIGKDCMLSSDIIMQTHDGHKIFDLDSNSTNNNKKFVIDIGDHVWLGRGVSILKGVKLPNNTIVGYGAVVTKSFEEEYTIIGGYPAKILKRKKCWSRDVNF